MNCKVNVTHSVLRMPRVCSYNRICLETTIRLRYTTICIPSVIIRSISDLILQINREEFLDESTDGYNNGPKISIDNNPLSIDRRLPEEAYITTSTVINCSYYREIAVLNHARYASANISRARIERGVGQWLLANASIDRCPVRIFM